MECTVCRKRLWVDATACDFCGGAPGPLSSWRTQPLVHDVPPQGAFSSLDRRLRVLTIALLLSVGTSVLILRDAAKRLSDLATPDDLTLLRVTRDGLDGDHALVGTVHFLVVIFVGVAYGFWLHAAYRNARRTGSALPWTEGWAVAWLYVPVLNLWRPHQVMDQLWRTSDPGLGPNDGEGWRARKGSALVGLWWLLCLLAAGFGNASLLAGIDLEGLRLTSWLDIVAGVAGGLGSVVLLVVARRIGRRQAARQESFLLVSR